VHHNPYFRGDAESLMKGMEDNAREHPQKELEIIDALEEGVRVAIFSRVKHEPEDVGAAVFHLFRFEGDRIAELWDVGQEVPQPLVNENGMF
jgi:predicted SnoaL-like aldol condensation-catalyzing enzyme